MRLDFTLSITIEYLGRWLRLVELPLQAGKPRIFFSVVNEVNFVKIATVNRPPDLSRPAVTRIKPLWQFNPGELF